MEIINHKAILGSISAENLVERYGSPLYVYESAPIRQRFNELKEAIKYPRLQIYYACKANSNIAILQLLRREGAAVKTVSAGEIHTALKAGYSSFQILFEGINLSRDELHYCVDKNIRLTIDSLSLLRQYGERYRGTDVILRINPGTLGVREGEDEKKAPLSFSNKLGIPLSQLEEARKMASEYRLMIAGLHVNTGTVIRDAADCLDAMEVLLQTAVKFENVEFLNIGGGFSAVCEPDQEGFDINHLGENITKKVQMFVDRTQRPVTLAIEPGRYILEGAGYLLVRVNTVKRLPQALLVGTDSGANQLASREPSPDYHPIMNGSNPDGEPAPCIVTGNLNDRDDLFTYSKDGPQPRSIAAVREGDILLIGNAGAYGFSLASNYSGRPRPAEILVEADGERLVRRRETFEEMNRCQVY